MVAALIGGFMLAAWLTGAAARWSAAGTTITMKTNMAVGLLFAGTSLFMLALRPQSQRLRRAGLAAAALVLLLGTLLLSQHLFHWNLGIDELLASELPGAVGTVSPNRVGPPGSSSLTLLGIGLLLLGLQRRRFVPYLGLALLLLNLVPAIGFLYGVGEFYSNPRTAIAWPTVLAMIALGSGLVLACPETGPMAMLLRDDAGGKLLRGLLPVAILLPLGLGFLRMLGQNRGLYDTGMGAGLFALAMMVVFTAVLWRSAARLSRSDEMRKQTETALREEGERTREQAARLRATLDAAPAIIWSAHDSECRTITGNRAAYEFSRVADGENLSKTGPAPTRLAHYRICKDGVELSPEEMPIQHVAASGQALPGYAMDFIFDDGAVRSVMGNVVPVLDAEGESQGAIAAFVDVTDQKRQEKDLIAAKAALESANAAKDQFIAKLSHELRTPLTPVVASLSALARDARIPEDLRDDIKLIERNIGLEVHLINDLLDVTRIVNGKMELRRQPLDLAVILRETAQIVATDLDAKAMTLSIDTPGAPYWVDADRARLHQVFWNLLKNAINYSSTAARISIDVAAIDGSVRIAVRDSGRGIDPAELPRLFRAFEQTGNGQTFGGLGLGLAICKGIVDLHGGSITAASEGEGRGATFTVELPLLPIAPQVTPPGRGDEPLRAKTPLHILLVEDHADTARIMQRLLMAQDHQVTWAGSVKEALALAGNGFDVVVSDIGLPDGSGYDLMRQLIASGNKAKGVAISGYGTADDVHRALSAGFVEHVTKPVSFESLHNALLRVANTPAPTA